MVMQVRREREKRERERERDRVELGLSRDSPLNRFLSRKSAEKMDSHGGKGRPS